MNWIELLYQYLIGGGFFFVTLMLCLQTGASHLENAADRKTVIYMVLGFALYLIVTTAWIILAAD